MENLPTKQNKPSIIERIKMWFKSRKERKEKIRQLEETMEELEDYISNYSQSDIKTQEDFDKYIELIKSGKVAVPSSILLNMPLELIIKKNALTAIEICPYDYFVLERNSSELAQDPQICTVAGCANAEFLRRMPSDLLENPNFMRPIVQAKPWAIKYMDKNLFTEENIDILLIALRGNGGLLQDILNVNPELENQSILIDTALEQSPESIIHTGKKTLSNPDKIIPALKRLQNNLNRTQREFYENLLKGQNAQTDINALRVKFNEFKHENELILVKIMNAIDSSLYDNIEFINEASQINPRLILFAGRNARNNNSELDQKYKNFTDNISRPVPYENNCNSKDEHDDEER